mmetsp:Transcript_1278/g.4579  ORF Transcript_1278/g.4579 Transcript_1278/m.4579 type:complete len:214 (+) Transcript_1278:2389-3030(+)
MVKERPSGTQGRPEVCATKWPTDTACRGVTGSKVESGVAWVTVPSSSRCWSIASVKRLERQPRGTGSIVVMQPASGSTTPHAGSDGPVRHTVTWRALCACRSSNGCATCTRMTPTMPLAGELRDGKAVPVRRSSSSRMAFTSLWSAANCSLVANSVAGTAAEGTAGGARDSSSAASAGNSSSTDSAPDDDRSLSRKLTPMLERRPWTWQGALS